MKKTLSLVTLFSLVSIAVFFASAGKAFASSAIYTNPGGPYVYVVGNYTQLDVQVAGGGGGGGGWGGGSDYMARFPGYWSYPGAQGGAGGAGGYTHVTIPVTPGQRINLYVGGGGKGGLFSFYGGSGAGGGSSYFGNYIAGGGGGGGGGMGVIDSNSPHGNMDAGSGGGGGGGILAGKNAIGYAGASGGNGYAAGGNGATYWWWPVFDGTNLGSFPCNSNSNSSTPPWCSNPISGGIGGAYGGNGGSSAKVTVTPNQSCATDTSGNCYFFDSYIYTFTSGSAGSIGSANGGTIIPGGGGFAGAGSSGFYSSGSNGSNGYVIVTPQHPVSTPAVHIQFN